jgi:hypothetical protein
MPHINHLFQINLPDDWEDITAFTFKGPIDNGVQHNIVLTIDDPIDKKCTLEEYVKQQMATSKLLLPGFEMIKEGENILLSGVPVYEVVYKYVPSDEQVLFQKQVFLIYEGKAYTFTSTFSKKTLKTIAHDVDKIIASFKPMTVEE